MCVCVHVSACVCVLSHNNLEVTAYQVCLNTCFEFILIHLNRQFTTLLAVLLLGFKSDTLLKYLLIQHCGVAIILISKVTGWSVIFQKVWTSLHMKCFGSAQCAFSRQMLYFYIWYNALNIFLHPFWDIYLYLLNVYFLFIFIVFEYFYTFLFDFYYVLKYFWLLRYRQFEMFMVFPTTNHLLFLSIDICSCKSSKIV